MHPSGQCFELCLNINKLGNTFQRMITHAETYANINIKPVIPTESFHPSPESLQINLFLLLIGWSGTRHLHPVTLHATTCTLSHTYQMENVRNSFQICSPSITRTSWRSIKYICSQYSNNLTDWYESVLSFIRILILILLKYFFYEMMTVGDKAVCF